jgi:hypothetical protein
MIEFRSLPCRRRLPALFTVTAGLLGLWAVGLAGSAAAATASARHEGPTLFVQSAKSGELRGVWLTLYGVGRTVTSSTPGGRSGVVSIARMQDRLFGPQKPPALGTLLLTGRRPGTAFVLKLSRPRYSAARRSVRYLAKRVSNGGAGASGVGSGRASRSYHFGAATLSIIGAPPKVLGSSFGGNDCMTTFYNGSGFALKAISASNWPDDTWDPSPLGQTIYSMGDFSNQPSHTTWWSDGGLFRGCSASAAWQVLNDPYQQGGGEDPGPGWVVRFTTTYLWNGSYTNTCTSSVPQDVGCTEESFNTGGQNTADLYFNGA